jgi:hypothetical protein
MSRRALWKAVLFAKYGTATIVRPRVLLPVTTGYGAPRFPPPHATPRAIELRVLLPVVTG